MKELRDGKLVDVDDQGNVIDPNAPVKTVEVSKVATGPFEGTDNNLPVSEVKAEANDALLNSPGKLSDAEKKNQEQLKDKLTGEGEAAAARDLSSTLRAEGNAPPNNDNPDTSLERPDGTVTSRLHPELTAHYVSGTRVLMTDEEAAKYKDLVDGLAALQGNLALSDIPTYDPYYEKKKELDAFTARLKR